MDLPHRHPARVQGDNLVVTQSGNDVEFALASDVTGLNSVTATTVNTDALNVTGGPVIDGSGITLAAGDSFDAGFIYGYLNRIPSSRWLEREEGRNVEVIWLIGNIPPAETAEQLQLAGDRARLARRLFELGRGDNFTATDAEAELLRAQSRQLENESEVTVAAFRLKRVTGTLVESPDALKPRPPGPAVMGQVTP